MRHVLPFVTRCRILQSGLFLTPSGPPAWTKLIAGLMAKAGVVPGMGREQENPFIWL